MAKERIRLKDNKEYEAKIKAKGLLKNKEFEKLTRAEKDELLLELLKMYGLI